MEARTISYLCASEDGHNGFSSGQQPAKVFSNRMKSTPSFRKQAAAANPAALPPMIRE